MKRVCMTAVLLLATCVAFGQTKASVNTKLSGATKQTVQATDATTQATMTTGATTQTTEATVEKANQPLKTIIAKATELANKLVAAIKAGNTKKADQVKSEVADYTETLSNSDLTKFKEVANKILKTVGIQL